MASPRLGRVGLVAALALGLASSSASAAPMTYFDTVFGTDYAYFATGGMRGNGTGQITVSGITGSVTRAVIHWHGPSSGTDLAAGAAVTFNGTDIIGTALGLASDNCWGFENSKAYFADVTGLVTGDGVYSLTDFLGPGFDMNGVSLEVFFDDGDDTNDRDIVMFHGNDSNITSPFDPAFWQATLNGINYSGGPASIILGVADGQAFADEPVYFNSTSNVLFPSNSWDGTNVPGGVPGLWDIREAAIQQWLSTGLNSCSVFTDAQVNDCLGLIHVSFNLPAGAAPPPPNGVPEPTSALLIALALAGAVRQLRLRA